VATGEKAGRDSQTFGLENSVGNFFMRALASRSAFYICYGLKYKLSRTDSIIESCGRKLITFNVKFISVNCIVNNFFITIVLHAKFRREYGFVIFGRLYNKLKSYNRLKPIFVEGS
jgi:hypothetical protein